MLNYYVCVYEYGFSPLIAPFDSLEEARNSAEKAFNDPFADIMCVHITDARGLILERFEKTFEEV